MLDRLRNVAHRALVTSRGDAFAPIRVSKDALRRLNVTLGYPVASSEELARRADAARRLAELRARGAEAAPKAKVQAPITVYVEKNRNARQLERVIALLDAKSYAHRVLDVEGDENTMTFVTRKAECEPDDLPIVFVGDTCIGGLEALVAADVSGALAKAVWG
jgi:hypothetical protein